MLSASLNKTFASFLPPDTLHVSAPECFHFLSYYSLNSLYSIQMLLCSVLVLLHTFSLNKFEIRANTFVKSVFFSVVSIFFLLYILGSGNKRLLKVFSIELKDKLTGVILW